MEGKEFVQYLSGVVDYVMSGKDPDKFELIDGLSWRQKELTAFYGTYF